MPTDLSRYPHWQHKVDTDARYRKLWLEDKFPPPSVAASLPRIDFPHAINSPIKPKQQQARLIGEPPRPNLITSNRISTRVGTELSKLLAKFGIKANEGCKCKSRALEMDHRGIEWCIKNIELIVDWLEDEARKRHLPFVRTAGKILIKRAIRNAKAAASKQAQAAKDPIHKLRDQFEMRPTNEAFTN